MGRQSRTWTRSKKQLLFIGLSNVTRSIPAVEERERGVWAPQPVAVCFGERSLRDLWWRRCPLPDDVKGHENRLLSSKEAVLKTSHYRISDIPERWRSFTILGLCFVRFCCLPETPSCKLGLRRARTVCHCVRALRTRNRHLTGGWHIVVLRFRPPVHDVLRNRIQSVLFGAFCVRAHIFGVDFFCPLVFTSLLLGVMMPYAFAALTMKPVGKEV